MTETARRMKRMKLFRSIYKEEGVEFKDTASISTPHHSIYIQKLNNNLNSAIKKHESSRKLRKILRSRKGARKEKLTPMMNQTLPAAAFKNFKIERSQTTDKRKNVNFDLGRSHSLKPMEKPKTSKLNRTTLGFGDNRSKSTRNYNYRMPDLETSFERKRANSFKIRKRKMKLPEEFQEMVERKKFKTKNFNALPPSKVIDFIVKNRVSVTKDYNLFEGLKKLRNNNLLKDKNLFTQKIQKASFKGYVYNDYHNSNTNNGYSRNFGGMFFYR